MIDIDKETKIVFDGLTEGYKAEFIRRYELGKKKPWAFYLWLLIFGRFGAHRFYLNQTGMGFLYLFTHGVLFFGCFVDLIMGVELVREFNERLSKQIMAELMALKETNNSYRQISIESLEKWY